MPSLPDPRPDSPTPPGVSTAKIGDLAASAGLRRIHVLAWRDLDDVEAGGSEIHAANVARIWAEAGIDVVMRTSFASGHPAIARRDGYRVVRKAGRYAVFPRSVAAEMAGRHGGRDGLVEIWNGVPFLSPVWCRGPRVVWLHHVHQKMWKLVLAENPRLAAFGALLERRLAPPLYRSTPIVTLSESSRQEVVDLLGFRPGQVRVVPPGVDPRFSPGGKKADHPLVLSVSRLMAPKRFEMVIHAAARLKPRVPDLELVIVGKGEQRPRLEALIADLGAEDWITLAGHVEDEELISLYRRAWVLTNASVAEGWGMTITEAAACGTPSVVTRIPGHTDAVDHGLSGLLVDTEQELGTTLGRVLTDTDLRRRLAKGALERAAELTWHATAAGTLAALVDDASRRTGARRRPDHT